LAEGLDATAVASRALDAGLVLNAPGKSMLRFLPPLVIGGEEVNDAIDRLRDVLA
jgi:4-aminobutyrate aminotransferase-like enzyme